MLPVHYMSFVQQSGLLLRAGDSPQHYERDAWLFSKGNKRKMEPGEIPSRSIPRRLIALW